MFLDQGSTATLCELHLLQHLGISGEEAKYSLTTVNQTKVNVNVKRATLLVSALNDNQYTELTEVFSVEKLPISSNPCLTETELNNWTYLRGIEIPKLNNPDVQLLIGIDNPELFWTHVMSVMEGEASRLPLRLFWDGQLLVGLLTVRKS